MKFKKYTCLNCEFTETEPCMYKKEKWRSNCIPIFRGLKCTVAKKTLVPGE